MSTEPIRIDVSGNIKADIAKKIRDIGAAALEADAKIDILKATLGSLSGNMGAAFKTATGNVKGFSASLVSAASTTRAFRAAIDNTTTSLGKASSAASKFANSLRAVDGASNKTRAAVSSLHSSIGPLAGAFATVFSVGKYIEAQDAMTSIDNRIRSLGGTIQEQIALQRNLFEVANRTRTGVLETANAFTNYQKALSASGASTGEVLRLVETLSKSLQVAGRSAGETASVVAQLGQALTSGKLNGDEFRSLRENAPVEVMEALAKTLGVTRAELGKLSEEGKITAEVVRKALGGMAAQVDAAFARTVPTISSQLTVLNNKFIEFTQKSNGAAAKLGEAIKFIGDNLEWIVPAVVALGAAFAAVQLAALIRDFGLLALALGSASITIAGFAAGAVTATATVLGLAFAMAKLTGNEEKFHQGMAVIRQDIANFGESIKQAAMNAVGIDTLNNSLLQTGANLAPLAPAAANAAAGIQVIAGGRIGMDQLKTSTEATSTAVTGLKTSFATLNPELQHVADLIALIEANGKKSRDALQTIPGAMASISGQYTGVINVAKALEAQGTAAQTVGTNAGFATEQLKSISGNFTGVTRVTTALQEQNGVLKQLASSAKAYGETLKRTTEAAKELASASDRVRANGSLGGNRNNPVPNPGDSSGSFTNITGNNSSQRLNGYARGGSFAVRGKGGNDNNIVRFRAQKGERVDISTAAEQRRGKRRNSGGAMSGGAPMFIFNISTPDANSFGASRAQLASDTFAAMGG